VLSGVAALVVPRLAAAHAPDQSYIFVRIYDDALVGRVEMTITDLNDSLDLDLPEDGSVTVDQLQPLHPVIEQYLVERVSFAPNGAAMPLRIDELDLYVLPLGQFLRAHFSFEPLDSPPKFVDVVYAVLFDKRPSHRGLLVIEHNWKAGTFNNEMNVSLIFGPEDTQQTFSIEGSVLQGFLAMIGQGAHHIWIGIDHVLFLFALLLPSVVRYRDGRWVPLDGFQPALIYVLKIVTIFTVAHTITLSAAAIGAIRLPSRLVESVIALSIAIAAVDILRQLFGRRIWWVVFAFGLFHGFGFASVLADIGIGGEFLAHTLLGFNLGVELGQIGIVAVIFPILFLLRRARFYTKMVLPLCGLALIAISIYWVIERGFGIDIPAKRLVELLLNRFL
jgi:hypothetical protein